MSDAMVPCFKCGKKLKNAFPDADNQPSKGTEFSTYGHYGSTFWDAERDALVLNVCDKCLRAGAERLVVRRKKERRTVDYEMTPYIQHPTYRPPDAFDGREEPEDE